MVAVFLFTVVSLVVVVLILDILTVLIVFGGVVLVVSILTGCSFRSLIMVILAIAIVWLHQGRAIRAISHPDLLGKFFVPTNYYNVCDDCAIKCILYQKNNVKHVRARRYSRMIVGR